MWKFEDGRSICWHALGLGGSVALHWGLLVGLGEVRILAPRTQGATTVSFEVQPRSPAPPVGQRVKPSEPDPQPPPAPPSRTPPPRPEPLAEPRPQRELAQPIDLSGVTLTNDGPGAGWSSSVGDGGRLRGPILGHGPRPAERRSEPVPLRVESAPRTSRVGPSLDSIPLADLSRRPVPPALNGKLERNYPLEARREGRSGTAVVSARIDADGRVRIAGIVSESAPGFGAACQRTVLGSAWSPPLDRSGRPVATQVSYTCRFQVDG